MATNSKFKCPHCNGTLLAFPKETSAASGYLLESTADTLADDYLSPYEVPAPYNATYRYSSPPPPRQPQRTGFWNSDGANSVLMAVFVGVVVLLLCWYYDWPGYVAAGLSILTGVVLYTTRIMALAPKAPLRPAPPTPPAAPPPAQPISIELISEDKQHWIMTELNKSITQKDLINVARAVVFSDYTWTRDINTKAGLSQPKHRKLQEDLLRLTFLREKPNNENGYLVTGRGRRFFQEIASTH